MATARQQSEFDAMELSEAKFTHADDRIRLSEGFRSNGA
jgi:hypothetical protein